MSKPKSQDSNCPVTRGEVDLGWYQERDEFWREVGLAAPARRALIDASIMNLNDLRTRDINEIAELHGIGRNALVVLNKLLSQKA